MSGHNPDPRATPIRLSLASVPEHRDPLPTTWARYVGGDYPGLYALASRLYKFSSTCNTYIAEMTKNINHLIASDHEYWSGRSTGAFKASYGQDAIIMNGFGRTVTATAGVVDTLAHQLAQLEHGLEQNLQAAYDKGFIVHDGLGPHGPNFKPNPKYVNSPNKATSNGVLLLMQRLQQQRDAALVRADDYRDAAAASLAVLNHSLTSGFRYYLGETGVNGTLDPKGLLSPDQLKSDKLGIDRLEKQLAQQEHDLNNSGIDLKKVVADLQKGGNDAQQIAGIIGHFKGVQGAAPLSSLLQKSGNLAEEIGPLILEIGGFAALTA